jgi:cell division protein FtsN
MNQQADGAMRNHRAPMRTFVLVTALAALTMGGAGLARVASAQSNPTPRPETPAPRPDTQGRALEAPVGHRQPRPQDLPPSVRREEGTRTPEQEALDKKLEICRGC